MTSSFYYFLNGGYYSDNKNKLRVFLALFQAFNMAYQQLGLRVKTFHYDFANQ